ncbi:phage minor capsid protein [Psychrobacillus sp. L3]|uniref:phage minor capsid protein n=1 Tax=Psychrobacillus sp. L3 TaxID=3236891 RepID=UPI0036F30C0C
MEEKEYESIEQIDEDTDKLISKYRIAYTTILALLIRQIDEEMNDRQTKKLLKEVNLILVGLDEEAKVFLKSVFPQYYLFSLKNIDSLAIQISDVKKLSRAEHAIHKEALKRATNDLYNDLDKNTRYLSREAKKIIRDNAQSLITAMIEGGDSYITVKKKLREQLLANGISSFKDAGSRVWKIDRYADMVIRTKSRILHNEGTLNRLKEYQEKYAEEGAYSENFDLIQISKHGAADWCRYYEDMVFSISGESKNYPSIETLPNRPYNILHPGCKHIFLAYMSALMGKGETVNNKYQSLSMKELNKIDYESLKKK